MQFDQCCFITQHSDQMLTLRAAAELEAGGLHTFLNINMEKPGNG